MAARRRLKINAAGWSRRLAGVALCAFFALGVVTGVSAPGRAAAARAVAALHAAHGRVAEALESLWLGTPPARGEPAAAGERGAIAIVERRDGFYALSSKGTLRGPISPRDESDLPILSGPAVDLASARSLVSYAAILIRAEGGLSEMISEMYVDGGTATLFLSKARTEIVLDVARAPLEIRRASEVLRRWRGHRTIVAALDMTTPGEAVMRLRGVTTLAPAAWRAARRRAGTMVRASASRPEASPLR